MNPKRPQNPAGMRIDPPPSVATCIAPMPNAAATAAPPLLPPGVIRVFHGFTVRPLSGLSVTPFQPNSGVVVLAKTFSPAARWRCTSVES